MCSRSTCLRPSPMRRATRSLRCPPPTMVSR
jgi:hypothetical protein